MAMLVLESWVEKRLKAERQANGADRFDEVWDGVYVMSPAPNDVHQELIANFIFALKSMVGPACRGSVRPGVNVSDRDVNWEHNYRIPDVSVFLEGGRAQNRDTHWVGGPDFIVEIISPDDRSRDKLAFYASIGVRELLLVDRAPWRLELYQLRGEQLVLAGLSSLAEPASLASAVLPLHFRLIAGTPRPQIEVTHTDGVQTWLV
jgi:Uma2 family endonuclease